MAEPAYREPASIPRIDPAWDLLTEAELPFDDGLPLPDGDFQRDPLSYALYGLRDHFAARSDVAVQGDMFLHYLEVDDNGEVVLDDEGQPVRGMVAPDVYVIFGAPNRERQSFVSWDEGKLPDFVLEILSSSTWRHDISAKRALYQRLGVPEFWVADPMGAFVHPRVQGYRLVAGVYTSIDPLPGKCRVRSEVLGLELRVEDGLLRIHDPQTGRDIHDIHGAAEALRQSEAARRQSEAALRQSETALRQSEAARRQADAERQRLDAERKRLDAARRQADDDRKRFDAARRQADAERRKSDVARQEAERRTADAERRIAELRRKQ